MIGDQLRVFCASSAHRVSRPFAIRSLTGEREPKYDVDARFDDVLYVAIGRFKPDVLCQSPHRENFR